MAEGKHMKGNRHDRVGRRVSSGCRGNTRATGVPTRRLVMRIEQLSRVSYQNWTAFTSKHPMATSLELLIVKVQFPL